MKRKHAQERRRVGQFKGCRGNMREDVMLLHAASLRYYKEIFSPSLPSSHKGSLYHSSYRKHNHQDMPKTYSPRLQKTSIDPPNEYI